MMTKFDIGHFFYTDFLRQYSDYYKDLEKRVNMIRLHSNYRLVINKFKSAIKHHYLDSRHYMEYIVLEAIMNDYATFHLYCNLHGIDSNIYRFLSDQALARFIYKTFGGYEYYSLELEHESLFYYERIHKLDKSDLAQRLYEKYMK